MLARRFCLGDMLNVNITQQKIYEYVYTKFEERKVPQAASDSFAQKWLFFQTYLFGQNFLKPSK